MDIAELVLEYVKVGIWPCTVLMMVILFRGHIKGVLARLNTGELDALGVKVRVDLDKAQSEVQRAEDSAASTTDSVEDEAVQEAQAHLDVEFETYFHQVEKLRSAPNATADRIVSMTFIAYIQAVIACADALGLDPANSRFPARDVYGAAALELQAVGVMSDDMASAAQRLIRIYNSQSTEGVTFTKEVSDLYFSTAYELAGVIVSASKNALKLQLGSHGNHEPRQQAGI